MQNRCCPTKFKGSGLLLTKCGKCIRGLLCTSCNSGLGMFSDDVERLISAISYLQKHTPKEYLAKELSLDSYKTKYEFGSDWGI